MKKSDFRFSNHFSKQTFKIATTSYKIAKLTTVTSIKFTTITRENNPAQIMYRYYWN